MSIKCLECGKEFEFLVGHIVARHMPAAAYLKKHAGKGDLGFEPLEPDPPTKPMKPKARSDYFVDLDDPTLRRNILYSWKRGTPVIQINKVFGVSTRILYKWEEEGILPARPKGYNPNAENADACSEYPVHADFPNGNSVGFQLMIGA